MTDPDHERAQDKCPKCGNRSDEYWPWCSPTGPDWGKCSQCGAPSFPREAFDQLAHPASVEGDEEAARADVKAAYEWVWADEERAVVRHEDDEGHERETTCLGKVTDAFIAGIAHGREQGEAERAELRDGYETVHLAHADAVQAKHDALAEVTRLLRAALADMLKWDSSVLPTPLYVVKAARALLSSTQEPDDD